MDVLEQQGMSENQPQIKNKLKSWYDWLVSHNPKPIKEKASRAFKDKIMGLYKRVKGEKEPEEEQNEELFNPVEVEQAFSGAYRSYRIHERSRMDVETFFDRIRPNLIDLMNREQTRVQQGKNDCMD